MLEKGTYRARASNFGLGFSQNKGTPQCSIEFTVSDGPYTGDTITANLYFTEKTQERTIRTLRLMGWTGTEIGAIGIDDLQNEVLLVVQEEEYEGRRWPRVQWINDPNRSGLQLGRQMMPNELSSFSNEMRGVAMKFAAGTSEKAGAGSKKPSQPSSGGRPAQHQPTPPTGATPAPDYPNDDDIPF